MNKFKNANIILIVKTLMGASAILLYEGIRVTNVLSFAIILGIFFFFVKSPKMEGEKEKTILTCVAIIITFLCCLHGTQVLNAYEINGLRKLIAYFIMPVGLFAVFERIIEALYYYTVKIKLRSDSSEYGLHAWKTFIIMLACWTPFFLWNYPGCVNSDSTTQILQAMGIYPYSNHHPILQTWIIKLVFDAVAFFTESLNSAVAIFIMLQCLFLAAVYSYVLAVLREFKIAKAVWWGVLAYYAIVPYNIMMSINMWKDTAFSAGMVLMITALWRANREDKKIDLSLLFIGGIIVCMFRNNGWYAFLVTLPFLIVFLWKKNKKACTVLGAICVTSIILRGPVFDTLGVTKPNIMESLAIPMQQISNVVAHNKVTDEKDRKLISAVANLDEISKNYNIHEADPVKFLIVAEGNTDVIEANKAEYLKLWIRLGLDNPGLYLQAFVNQTEGFYNPDIQRWQYIEGVWDTSMPIYNNSLLPEPFCKVLQWYTGDWFYDIPVLGMVKSMGFWVWVMFVACGLCLIKKDYGGAVLFLPVIACWGTLLLATPAYAEFRYAYSIFTTMPVLLCISLYLKRTEN